MRLSLVLTAKDARLISCTCMVCFKNLSPSIVSSLHLAVLKKENEMKVYISRIHSTNCFDLKPRSH
ncbi:hypothetical protein HanRHA438_Chr09g0383031 [Helianthus annuus]|nr:hypothetical protein HanRHA438_Chr09g0383031 [Helianthus annuus]